MTVEDFYKSEFCEKLEEAKYEPHVTQRDDNTIEVYISVGYTDSCGLKFLMNGDPKLNSDNIRSMKEMCHFANRFDDYAFDVVGKPYRSEGEVRKKGGIKASFHYCKGGWGSSVELEPVRGGEPVTLTSHYHLSGYDYNRPWSDMDDATPHVLWHLDRIGDIYGECEKTNSLFQQVSKNNKNRDRFSNLKDQSKDVEPFVYAVNGSSRSEFLPLSVYLEIAKEDSAFTDGSRFHRGLPALPPDEITILGRVNGKNVAVKAEVPTCEPREYAAEMCDKIIKSMEQKFPGYESDISVNDQAYINAHTKHLGEEKPAPEKALQSASYRIVDKKHKSIPQNKDEIKTFLKSLASPERNQVKTSKIEESIA